MATERPVLLRPVQHVSDGTDLTGSSTVTVATGLYANVIALAQACFTDDSGIDNVRLSDDFYFEIYSTTGQTITWNNSDLGTMLGFENQITASAGVWATAPNRPRNIWIPEDPYADQGAFLLNLRDTVQGAIAADGTLSANKVGPDVYERSMSFTAELATNISREFVTTDEDVYHTLTQFVLGSMTASPEDSTIANPRGFWFYPDINDAIADCTYQPHVDQWSTDGGIDFNLTASPDEKVFCHFDKSALSDWTGSPFFQTSRLRYNTKLNFHTAPAPTLTAVSYPWSSSFTALDYAPGVDNLSASITFPQGAVTPTFRYKGGDADGTDWDASTYGDTLTLQSGTAPTYNTGSPFWGISDDSVTFNNGGYYQDGSAFTGFDYSDDLFIEGFVNVNYVGSHEYIVATRGSGSNGFQVYVNTSLSGGMTFYMRDNALASVFIHSNVATDGLVYFSLCYDASENSSNGGCFCVNGSAVFKNIYGLGTVTQNNLTIGADALGSFEYNDAIFYLAAYSGTLWDGGSSNATDMVALHEQRYHSLCGTYPTTATDYSTTFTRASEAYTYSPSLENGADDLTKRLWSVGDAFPRVAQWADENGLNTDGFWSEQQRTNLITYSNEMSNWTEIDATDVTTDDDYEAPDHTSTMSSLAASTTDGQHGWYTTATLTAATYTFSGYIFGDNTDWIRLENTTLTNSYAIFNLSSGTVYETGASATGRISKMKFDCAGGETCYKCEITFTGTAASHTLRVRALGGTTTPTDTFAGDGSIKQIGVWGMQCELGEEATSPIITSGATATRLKDVLTYTAGDNIGGEDIGEGEIYGTIHLNSYNSEDSDKTIIALSDGGSSADKVRAVLAITDVVKAESAATGGNAGGTSSTVDVTDNDTHDFRIDWDDNDLRITVDTITSGGDPTCDMPDDLDTIHVGSDEGDDNQINGLVSDIVIKAPS